MPHPYQYSLLPDTGLYTFQTEQNLTYFCGFTRITHRLSPIIGVYDIDVYDFEFSFYDEHPEIRKFKDPRISDTLIKILTGFFSSPFRVLIYVCDSVDGKHEGRQALFKRWAVLLPIPIKRNELNIYFEENNIPVSSLGCVLTMDPFPHPDVLKDYLLDEAQGIILEKYREQEKGSLGDEE